MSHEDDEECRCESDDEGKDRTTRCKEAGKARNPNRGVEWRDALVYQLFAVREESAGIRL